MKRFSMFCFAACAVAVLVASAAAQEKFIPRRQSKLPGPPLSPQDAIKKMTVPEGFQVELVAAEPDIVNPVAMAFDERGRIWITESIEYPRRSPGKTRFLQLKVILARKSFVFGNWDGVGAISWCHTS